MKQASLYDVQIIHALALWGAEVDYTNYLNKLDSHIQASDSGTREQRKRYRYIYVSKCR